MPRSCQRYGVNVCGRYAADANPDTLVEEFHIDKVVGQLPLPSYNVAPTHDVPVVWVRPDRAAPGTQQRQLTSVRWGLVPSWAATSSVGAKMINARRETVTQKPSFRAAMHSRRCLLPAIGYYEWEATSTHRKQPVFLHPRDGGLLVMAGLYEFWKDTSSVGEPVWWKTCTIITMAAHDDAGKVHERMPVTIHPHLWDTWLDPDIGATQAMALIDGDNHTRLTTHPVSDEVNRVTNNYPELILRLPTE